VNLEIRHLRTREEFELAVRLQRDIWGDGEVPAHVLLTAAHNGGLCAGAFVDDELAGFVWGFLGFDDRVSPPRLKHCSHQLGVHPAYRNLGLGLALKRFQWQFVREQGIDLITWTYDPLLATNAHLNIARLGAVCNTYRQDEYGRLDDDLNVGLPTDRFQVDLWLNSPRVCAAMEQRGVEPGVAEPARWLNPPAAGGAVHPPDAAALSVLQFGKSLAVAIPADFQSDRAAGGEAAAAWRIATREAFETLFARGYTVFNFLRYSQFGCYILDPE
jgi:predicted GNAT superfamily acetyltransferase